MQDDGIVFAKVNDSSRQMLFDELESLRLPPERRFRLARELAREVKKYSAARVRAQQSLDGGPFAPRSTRRNRWRKDEKNIWRKKRKMLMSLGKAKNMAEYRDGQATVVSWKKKSNKAKKKRKGPVPDEHWANIAFAHQRGMSFKCRVNEAMQEGLRKWHISLRKKQATPKMAEALLRNGYRLPVKKKGGKIGLRRVNARYIRNHMKQMQAAWILRLLVRQDVSRESPKKPKAQSWEITLPARPFLGVTEKNAGQLRELLAQKLLNGLKK